VSDSRQFDNGRTHEPSFQELVVELDGFRKLMDERDRRYEDRFTAMDEKTGLALTSSEKAVAKAETATEKRFDAVNEFRGQLKDQAATLLPRSEASVEFISLRKDLEELKKSVTMSQGRTSGFNASWGIAISIALLAIALIGIILRAKP
jgi:hypothetical protein